MTRLGSLILCATLVTGLAACGGNGTSTKDPLEFVPLDNDVSGWLVDTAAAKTPGARAMTATTEAEAVGLIDGGAAPFYKPPFTPKMFLWQNYFNNSLPAAPPPDGAYLILYIWEMPTADQASALYGALLQESEYSGNWEPTSPTLGTESRIEDTVTAWWINFYQDVFYVEVMLGPSFGPASTGYAPSNPDLKNETMRFAEAIASKI
jgi:hypothetical protein